jgi:peptidylprolyl isomerase
MKAQHVLAALVAAGMMVSAAGALAQTRTPAGAPAGSSAGAPGSAPAPVPVPFAPPPIAGFTPPQGTTLADWREADPQMLVVYDTTKGRILVELAPWVAPRHVARIRELVREGFYDGVVFHRVIEGFMAQGGDPTGTGGGGSTKPDLAAEFTFRRGAESTFTPMPGTGGAQLVGFANGMPVTTAPDANRVIYADRKVPAFANHCPGVASMARTSDPNSANSQFFLMRGVNNQLDRQYTAWGRVVSGLDVVLALKTGEPVANPDRMTRVRLAADIPARERPRVIVQRTEGPAFRNRLIALAAVSPPGTVPSNCSIQPEAVVLAP